MDFSLADLSSFLAVAERCNFRAAAEAVHLSQPALSRRIEKLERALGERLFERDTRHVVLTNVGRAFEPRARQLLHGLQETLLGLSDAANRQVPEVRLACVTSAVRYLLADALIAFRQRHPRVRISIVDGGAHDVLAAVARGEVDFGFNFLTGDTAQLHFEPLYRDPYVAICARSHPLAGRSRLRWEELLQYDYLSVNRDNGNRVVLDLALAGRLAPQPVCEVRRIASLLTLVEAGVGVAAVPRLAAPRHSDLLCVIALEEPAVDRVFGVSRRTRQPLPPAAQAFLDFFMCWVQRPQCQARHEAHLHCDIAVRSSAAAADCPCVLAATHGQPVQETSRAASRPRRRAGDRPTAGLSSEPAARSR